MTLAFLALLGAPYIYDIISLRVNLIYSTTQQFGFRIMNYFSSLHIIRIQRTSGANLETEILSMTFMPFLFIHSYTVSYCLYEYLSVRLFVSVVRIHFKIFSRLHILQCDSRLAGRLF